MIIVCVYGTCQHNQCINAITQLCSTMICLVFVCVSIRYFSSCYCCCYCCSICALSKCQLVHSTVTLVVTHTQSCCHKADCLSMDVPQHTHTQTRIHTRSTNTATHTNTFQTFDTCSTGRKTTQSCLLSCCHRLKLLLLLLYATK